MVVDKVLRRQRQRGGWTPLHETRRYNGDLDAWIGTYAVRDEESYCDHAHFCICDAPEAQDGATPKLAWKVALERLAMLDPSLKPMYGPTLLLRRVLPKLDPGIRVRQTCYVY